jgi:hypothetical protein
MPSAQYDIAAIIAINGEKMQHAIGATCRRAL